MAVMMEYMIRTLSRTLILACLALPLAVGGELEDQVLAAEKGWAKSVVALDFSELDQIYHDDLIYAHSTGIIETKAEYMAKLRTGKQKYDAITHHKTIVRAQGDAAVAHSIVTMTGTNPAGPFDNKLMAIHAWFKHGGKWRLIAHQTTEIAK